jgi:hypothetical protein
MRKFISFFAFVFVCSGILFTSSCSEDSEDVDQDRIYSFFQYSYDASTNKTTAEARFSFGNLAGTALTLTSGSAVMCNDIPLIQTSQLGRTIYKTEFTGKVSSGKFSWTDTEGKTFVNTITIPTSIDYPTNFTEIDQSASYDLTWLGDAVIAGEAVRFTIGTDLLPYTQSINGATVVTLPKSRLEKIGKGAIDVELKRVDATLSISEKTSAGGSSEGIYTTGKKSITIK